MSKVKAKFKCVSVTEFAQHKRAELMAVSGNKGDNYDYAKYTPSGNMTISVDKETSASDFFKPDGEYYLTFENATPVIEAGE